MLCMRARAHGYECESIAPAVSVFCACDARAHDCVCALNDLRFGVDIVRISFQHHDITNLARICQPPQWRMPQPIWSACVCVCVLQANMHFTRFMCALCVFASVRARVFVFVLTIYTSVTTYHSKFELYFRSICVTRARFALNDAIISH